ncbi:TPA: major capsid family protein, partial [Salmonella enterica]
MITFDQATVDSSGAFLIGELERLDQGLNLPLVGYTWTRDIQLREDVSIADDISSWTNTSFGVAGSGANPNGKNWVGKDSTAIAGVNVDISKDGNPLNLWGMELGWTVVELAAAQQVGRPIDTQKYDGMQLKWQMDNDEQVYVGDEALGLKGLTNLVGVMLNNATKTWANSTNDEILDSVNSILSNSWAASGYSVVPS